MAERKAHAQHDEYKMVGKYKVRGALGEGVNGAVRLGVDPGTGRKVAIKFMSKVNMKQKQRDRLDREVRFLTLLHHPNIVELVEVIETPEAIIFVMDHVRKGELLKYITDHGHLAENKFRPIWRSILSAVDYCHRNLVVHRDLKPENILLDDNREPKIIDFGLSNLYDNENMLTTFCGSPKYAAPEIISGTKYLGPSVDIWSLGVILFAALCGTLPFAGSTLERTYQRIMAGRINYPAHLSAEAKDLIGGILKVDSDKRLSIEDMMKHPWTTKSYDGPPSNFLPHRPVVVSDVVADVLDQTVAFGYTKETVLQAIKAEAPSPIKSTYFLIAERKERLDQLKRERLQALDEETPSAALVRDKATGVIRFLLSSLRIKNNRKGDKDGPNVDLTYVVPGRVISMGYPVAAGLNKLYANPIGEVYAFLEKNHKDRYKVFNLVPGETGGYDPKLLGGQVVRFPVQTHGPTFEIMVQFCQAVDEWLAAEPANVVAVHAKGDYGRPAVMICAWLLHSGRARDTADALQQYNAKMLGTHEGMSPVRPSERRYIQYYEAFVSRDKNMPRPKLFALSAIVLEPVPDYDAYGGCDPIAKVSMNNVRVLKTMPHGHFAASKGDTHAVIECTTVPLSEDIYVRVLDKDRASGEAMLAFHVNVRFLELCHATEPITSDFAVPMPGKKGSDDEPMPHGDNPLVNTLVNVAGSAARSVSKKPSDAASSLAGRTKQAVATRVSTPPKASELTQRAADDDMPDMRDMPDMDEDEDEDEHEHEHDVEEDDADMPEEERHPLEREHFEDNATEAEAAVVPPPRPRRATPHLIFFQRPISDAQEHSTAAAPHHSSAGTMGSMTGDPYIASRIRVTLTKAELDLTRPDKFPDDFKVTLLLKEPRVRRYTAEDIEHTAKLEREAALQAAATASQS